MKGRVLLSALASALLLLGSAAGPAIAQDGDRVSGLEGLSNAYFVAIRGGYVARGVGLRNTGRGTIRLRGIPVGARVYRAFLYWNIVGYRQKARNAQVVFAGRRIVGTYVGADNQPGWLPARASAMSYRADVTAYVKANGNYVISGVASGRTNGADPWASAEIAPLAQGASLVVIFTKSSYPITRIWIWDGAATTDGTTPMEEITVGTFTATNPVGPAYATFIVADGESNSTEPDPSVNGAAIPVDFSGADPRAGARYSNGNLWDTKTVSVGRYLTPGTTTANFHLNGGPDVLTWVAQVFSISSGTVDTDRDSLLDGWEANGYPGRSLIDLPAMGASPWHKDVFVEHDWMTSVAGGDDHKPSATVLEKNRAAFATAPVINPDGRPGIRLHNDIGQGAPYSGGNQVTHTTYITTSAECAALWNDFDVIKNANFDTDRARVFHYVIWGHDICPELAGVSGISRGIPGPDYLVTLGSWPSFGSEDARTGTNMHELGHNLGLTHGGNTGDHENYKPSHLSIMNYSFQVLGVWRGGARRWDYTRMVINSLNETDLNEATGLGGSASLATYGTRWFCGDTAHDDNTADTNVDWNCSGAIQTSVSTNINRGDPAVKSVLGPVHNQWTNILYDGLVPGLAGRAPRLAVEQMQDYPCLKIGDPGTE